MLTRFESLQIIRKSIVLKLCCSFRCACMERHYVSSTCTILNAAVREVTLIKKKKQTNNTTNFFLLESDRDYTK